MDAGWSAEAAGGYTHATLGSQDIINAVVYGHKALGEAVRHDSANKPEQPLRIKSASGIYYNVWDSFALGFLAGSFSSGVGRRTSNEEAGVVAVLLLAFSSLAALTASVYNFVRGINLDVKVIDGRAEKTVIATKPSSIDQHTIDQIYRIYDRAMEVNSGIAKKKYAYGAAALTLAAGLAMLTATVALLYFRNQNLGWAVAAPGIILTGAGTTGLIVAWSFKRSWIPHPDNQRDGLAGDIQALIINNPQLFTYQDLLDLQILREVIVIQPNYVARFGAIPDWN